MLVPSHFFSALLNDTTQFITSFAANFSRSGNRILPDEFIKAVSSNTLDIRMSTIICDHTGGLEQIRLLFHNQPVMCGRTLLDML